MSAPFRIRPRKRDKETNNALEAIQSNKGGAKLGKFNDYLARLVSYIPSEVLGIYLMIQIAIRNADGSLASTYQWVSLACLTLVIFSRIMGTREKLEEDDTIIQQVEWPVVIISSISFVIWVMAIGDPFPWLSGIGWFKDDISIMALVAIWTFVIPYVYKPDASS